MTEPIRAIRSAMRERRARLSPREQEEASQAAARRLLASRAYARSSVIMAYMAARGELSLSPVIRDALASGRVLALPRCEGEGRMSARRVRALEELTVGAYGLWEPRADCPEVPPGEIDLILVPGVAFDRRGARIGQGGGYYDRFLPGTRALCVGVCHGFALAERIPQREHDQRMDAVLTPEEIVYIPRGGENTTAGGKRQ